MSFKNLTKFIGGVLTLLLLVFAYRYITGLIDDANFREVAVNWFWVVVSALGFILYYILLSIHWRLACGMIDPGDSSTSENQELSFFASQPYKYLPTSLFSFSYRAVYAKKLGLGVAKSSAAQLVEYASMLSANFLLFALFYLSTKDMRLTAGLLVLSLVVFVVFSRLEKMKLRLKNKNLHIDPPKLVSMVLLATGAWFICGIAFVSLNQALGFNIHFAELMAANCLAFLLSILAVFAPGGIGVREVVYSMFSVSNVAIIFWRILTFVMDCLTGTIAIILIRLKKQS